MTPSPRTHPARQHLVQQRAQTPPVHRLPVARAVQDFRRQVFRRAAEGLRAAVRLGNALLAEPEVGESDVALLGQQHVLRLQVAAMKARRHAYRYTMPFLWRYSSASVISAA